MKLNSNQNGGTKGTTGKNFRKHGGMKKQTKKYDHIEWLKAIHCPPDTDIRRTCPNDQWKKVSPACCHFKGLLIKNVFLFSFIKVYVFETRKAWNGWFCNKKDLVVKEKFLVVSIFPLSRNN